MHKSSKQIIVIGDVMLDQYWKGTSTRLSPEAPVPVVKVAGTENRLGGAANVALNLARLGAKVSLCGLVGTDQEANVIRKKLAEAGVSDHLVIGTDHFVTIKKIRVIAQNQQIVRTDFENEVTTESLDRLSETAKDLIKQADIVVFSDYKKGVLNRIADFITIARDQNAIILVDPKGNDYTPYKGATVITPNKSELTSVMGSWKSEKELINKAESLRVQLDIDKLLLTRSEEGMTLFEANGHTNFPTEALEVYDVSGAGDTAIATLALMLSHGRDWHTAVQKANQAAGIVVGRFGTAAVSVEDIGL